MVALVAADVTITVEQRRIVGKQRRNRVKIAFGNGALTIPAGGVPLPAAASFGMVRNLEYLTIFDENDASGIIWKYDKDNNKLRAWVQKTTDHAHDLLVANGAIATSGAIGLTAGAGLVGAVAATTVTGGIASGGVQSTTFATTALNEDTSSAPAAQTLYAEAVGW